MKDFVEHAIKEQIRLRAGLKEMAFDECPGLVGGADVCEKNGKAYGVIVVMGRKKISSSLNIVDVGYGEMEENFPYIPGLLAFREVPVLKMAWNKLKIKPGVILIDGSGRIHPREFGLACHLGVMLQTPTIGVAKSRLCGENATPVPKKGKWEEVFYRGKITGSALTTRDGCKPLFISAGHLMDLKSAISIVLNYCNKYRLPEPIRMAHRLAGKLSMSYNSDLYDILDERIRIG